MDMADASAALYRLLGDEARLRLLRLLSLDRLNVTELTGILGIAQSGVSRHLGLLKEGGLVSEEREAGYTYYAITPAVRDGVNGLAPALDVVSGPVCPRRVNRVVRADNARLEESGGCGRKTSKRIRVRIRTRDSWCRDEAGPRGRARSATCCRHWWWPISDAARDISRWRRAAGPSG